MTTEALANTLLHLVNIASVSGDEAELTDWFAHEMAAAGLPAARRARGALVAPSRSQDAVTGSPSASVT